MSRPAVPRTSAGTAWRTALAMAIIGGLAALVLLPTGVAGQCASSGDCAVYQVNMVGLPVLPAPRAVAAVAVTTLLTGIVAVIVAGGAQRRRQRNQVTRAPRHR